MRDILLKFDDVSFAWIPGGTPVLSDLSLSMRSGDMAAVLGPNGAGKSTLLRVASGYLEPASGEVYIAGASDGRAGRREIARRVAMVPQYSSIYLPYTVEELARLGRFPWRGLLGRWGGEDERAVSRALEVTGVSELAGRPVTELSGGEFQRAVIAKALAQEPELLLLDEPTAHLDIAYQMQIFEIIAGLNREEGLTVLAVLHDINLAAAFFDRVILIRDGRVYVDGPKDGVLTPENVAAVFDWPVKTITNGERRVIFPERRRSDG
ncbi:MAG: ABC transporter ATP-binding protein [Candidatus Coatesbacteria bacterium]|nr:MAG: ABC transporter ATP-binding protein [Candidatus Coatesbacteria bacterium]